MFNKFTRRRITKGGKPVFAGAQGCVFIPSLKCKGRPRNMKDGNISKLGYKEGSDFEMREYAKITPFIRKIRNYDKYFNIRVNSCEPDVLSTSDLINFNQVCRHNFNESITAENVNANLDKLRAINMPNLGMDLKEWIEKVPLDARRLRLLNNHISELLLRAVVPMNTLGVMHNDLKSENLMMDTKEKHVRIIDWGLAGVTSPHQVIPARYFMNNPVTYNRPFSTMIISSEIHDLLQNYTSPRRRVTAPEDLKPFVNGLYNEYRNLEPTGHKYLTYIFEAMFNLNPDTASAVLTEAVEKYNADILHHFTSAAGKFRLHDYFNKVYRYNTDVWGTLSVFYSIFMLPRDHFMMPDAVYQAVLNQYRAIFRTVFVNGHLRINVRSIAQHVQRINQLFTKTKFNKSVKAVRFNVQPPPPHDQMKRVPTPYPAKP